MDIRKGGCIYCGLIQDYGGGCLTCGGLLEGEEKDKGLIENTQIRNKINLISIDNKKSEIFGSYLFRSQTYPSDIDITEPFDVCCSKEDGARKIEKKLLDIIHDVMESRVTYFGEMKAGTDLRYLIDIDDPEFRRKIKRLNRKKLLSDDETRAILKLHSRGGKDDLDVVGEMLRMHYTIRWNQEEALRRYKVLPGGIKMSLREALTIPSFIKIDVWTLINGRYMEITNFFEMNIVDKNGNTIYRNVKLKKYDAEMRRLIKRLSSKSFYNPFKMAKRMWGLSRTGKMPNV